METPDTHYARNGDISLAYQLYGVGEPRLVLVPPVINHVELAWEEPSVARFLSRMASFTQVVDWDKRGQGLSDRIEGVPSLEERVDDLRAVVDHVGWDRFALAGNSEGGLMSILFAATYPDRVTHLFLFGSFARLTWAEDYVHGFPPEMVETILKMWAETWGTPESPSVNLFAKSRVGDAAFVRWMNRYERGTCTPKAFVETMRLNLQYDVRDAARTIKAPTLVMHRKDDPLVNVGHSRWLASNIPGARYVELEGIDHAPHFGPDADRILSELEEFLTGSVVTTTVDRVLRTVLFTDLVGSTAHAADVGDSSWRNTLDRFDDLTSRCVARERGVVVNHTGDGHLATFDGPARAIRCARDLGSTARNELGLDVRAGLHTGEVELRRDNVSGIAVHLAARVAAKAGAGQVLVSRTVTDLVAGSGLTFSDAGTHEMKGVPGEWQLFSVTG